VTAPRLAVLACLLALAMAGCGGDEGSPGGATPEPAREPATLLLDFTPNAVHAGIYDAVAHGYDDAAGVPLEIRTPSASTDALKLLQAGRADLAILDIHDLGLARQGGADLVGVMAIVQRPLAAVLAQPRIRTPRDLEGRRAGVTGLPSDRAVLRSVVSGAGGDPDRVRETTIGFEAVKALLAGRVDAATAFWNVEGVALKREKPATREFRVDDYGAPPYPELVLCVTRKTLRERPELVRGAIQGLRRGYEATIADPAQAIAAMTRAERGLDRADLRAQLAAVTPVFAPGGRPYGRLDPATLRAWAAWDVKFGILERRPDVQRAFDFDAAR
jgi:ABC-type nitrate/sulfonate/bicarbonate transport system substrate-binding protein